MKRFASAPAIPAVLVLGLLTGTFVRPPAASAQVPGYTPGDWYRVATEHFLFLYPEELEEWALDMAGRMESVHEAVAEMVGFAPEDRVTVLVDDPGNVSNGSMSPGPLLYMWPTPPNPRSVVGENRGWGEILAVHEFAHAAHLTRPSRNPLQRFLMSLVPIPVTDLMWSTPRWVTEGYATYIEGRLTGSGRPHGVWRPAILRTWALDGQLPTYGQVNGSGGFLGGSMAYLMGSAYLEWLVEREGGREEALPDLWRRLTARQDRSFDGAFEGVFGAPPAELYGHFTVDVTERALAIEDAVEAAGGVVDGELFQRLSWHVGDPAVSPDGERLALQLTSRDGPSRLVVISTTPDTLTTEFRERYEEVFREDPEDVEPVQRRPRPQSPEATLLPTLGRAYTSPAWMPDGDGILVVRSDIEENGRTRPDLFLWDWDDASLHRITRGAAIRDAAPAPDGTWAVGLRCLHASCDIVRIDLDSGAVTALTDTDPARPYYHPRVSPDGETIVASVQMEGEWRLVALDADGTNERLLGPDDGAARFDAEFLDDGRLVLTSTRGGIHDVEILDPATGEVVPVTRVVGSAGAPSAGAGSDIFFLSLHSRGWDLRRIARDAPPATPIVVTAPTAFPAATVPLGPGDTFPAATLEDPRPYGFGPRTRVLLPMIHLAEDGFGGGIGIGGTDPIGRLSWQLQAMYGSDEAPAGASLRARYRGFRPWLHAEVFGVRNPFTAEPPPGIDAANYVEPSSDAVFWGGLAALELRSQRLALTHGARVGASGGAWANRPKRGYLADGAAQERVNEPDRRVLGFGEYDLALRQGRGSWRLTETLRTHGAIGRTGERDWTRWLVSGSIILQGREQGIGLFGRYGGTDAPAGSVEEFAIGGTDPLLFDPAILSQQIAMPALQRGFLRGDGVRSWSAEIYGILPVTPFYWAADARGDGRDWFRLYGVRSELEAPPIPYIRLPAVRVRFGLARLLDDPGKDDWRAWIALGYAP